MPAEISGQSMAEPANYKAETKDFLNQSISDITKLALLDQTYIAQKKHDNNSSDSPNAAVSPEIASANAAKNKLAQEQLLQNPAEMRKLFPSLLAAISINHNDQLDLAEINKGLERADLPQDKKNLLTVLKAGYRDLSFRPEADSEHDGVSANSLAIVDKALNRKLNEDPIYAQTARKDLRTAIVLGLAVGVGCGRGDVKTRLGLAAISTAFSVVLQESVDKIYQLYGGDNEKYDQVERNYRSFVKDFDAQKY